VQEAKQWLGHITLPCLASNRRLRGGGQSDCCLWASMLKCEAAVHMQREAK
jgi:hypothetical protein